MKNFIRSIRMILNIYRVVPALFIFFLSSNKDVIISDIKRWIELEKVSTGILYTFCLYIIERKEFRNLVIYRLRRKGYVCSIIFQLLFPPMDTLYIKCTDIGKGLYIQHGFSTIISAKSIGENCYINQQVTIGYKGDKNPTIGNNVHICAGAIVIGDCHVGDNSIVGAGAVVVQDVPPNEVWGGDAGTLSEKKRCLYDGIVICYKLQKLAIPNGDGHACERIANILIK